MAMLAEKKRKQKWILNPRGTHWTDDVNKFGQKMLEKMGWTSGKGLGAKEDGAIEHIKVAFKNDSQGIGFKDTADQWTKHEDNFSNLLKNLTDDNSIADLKKPEQSLEMKSQNSRKRVHYHKFTRGKDLSRYSEKDLANIFGRKNLKKSIQPEIEDIGIESNKDFGVVTVEAGSMADYFRSKMAKFKNVNLVEIEKNSESDCERTDGFGFTSVHLETVEQNVLQPNLQCPVESNYNGFMKAASNTYNYSENFQVFNKDVPTHRDEIEVDNLTETKKKKKKKIKTSNENTEEALQDSKIITTDFPDKKEYSSVEKKKKIKLIDGNFESDISPPKKLKKYKMKNGIDNLGLNISCDEDKEEISKIKNEKKDSKLIKKCNENDIHENSEISIKKKKHKIEEFCFTNPCLEDTLIENHVLSTDVVSTNNLKNEENVIDKVKMKNKNKQNITANISNSELSVNPIKNKKKRKICNDDGAGSNYDEFIEDNLNATKKSKKSKINFGIDNPNFQNVDPNLECETFDYRSEIKKSKKPKLDVILEEDCTAEFNDKASRNNEKKKKQETSKTKGNAVEVVTEDAVAFMKSKKKKKKEKKSDIGIDNQGCTANSVAQGIEETIASMTTAIDSYQNELENEMNEGKDVKSGRKKFNDRNANKARKTHFMEQVVSGKMRLNFVGANLENIKGYGSGS